MMAAVPVGLGRNPCGLVPRFAFPLSLQLTEPGGYWVPACCVFAYSKSRRAYREVQE